MHAQTMAPRPWTTWRPPPAAPLPAQCRAGCRANQGGDKQTNNRYEIQVS
jgi:hypothetical protein